MPFDLMSDLKSFLQDKSIVCWVAILLEETLDQDCGSLPHDFKDNFKDEAPPPETHQASVCCSCSLPAKLEGRPIIPKNNINHYRRFSLFQDNSNLKTDI